MERDLLLTSRVRLDPRVDRVMMEFRIMRRRKLNQMLRGSRREKLRARGLPAKASYRTRQRSARSSIAARG